jgi:lipoprotein-anchoring transpeptidase ErfK/SrfK
MSLSRRVSGLALAALVMAGGLTSASSVKAEDLVDFLWGGSPEYGGGRSVVSFDPQYKPGQVIVSFSDRRLYWIMKPGVALTYPVAIPTGEARWQGVTSVTSKRVNPSWTPTPDMVRANPRLPRWVPGGHPMNPLGIRAMYLGSSAYRIHGTDAPWTIGQAVSHGCIRMTNEDVLDLYPRVPVGTRVTVTWQQFKTETVSDGSGIPRYSDKDSNPRAAAAPDAPAAVQAASAETSPSGSSTYTYRPYGSGKAQSVRTASPAHEGGIGGLFFWDQPKQQSAQSTPDSADPERGQQASRDATKDDDNFAADKNPVAEKKQIAESPEKPATDKPVKKVHEAKAEIKEPAASPETTKKKVSEAPAKKKASGSTTAKAAPPADPAADPAMAVPDPVKPTVSTPVKASEASSGATKASASGDDVAHVQKASVQVQ